MGCAKQDLVPILAMLVTAGVATADQKAALDQTLEAKYRLTTVNAEGEFVITGTTLVLRKNGLVAGAHASCVDDYREGRFSLGGNVLQKANCARVAGAPVGVAATRRFVAGEKLYVTKIEVKDAVIFNLISAPVAGVRYKAEVRFRKAGSLDVAPAEQIVAEAFGIGGGDGEGGGTAPAQPLPAAAPAASSAMAPIPPPLPPPPAPTDKPLAPIVPPPPRPDQPAAALPAISAGMSVDQVVAVLGQPDKIADLGSKKIYSYPTQKVTFVDGKVSPVQDSVETQTSSMPVLLLYEIGLGALVVVAAAILLLRRNRRAGMIPPAPTPAPPPAAMPPVPPAVPPPVPPVPQSDPPQTAASLPQSQAAAPMNPVKSLAELEKLMELGVLTREEFEREKDKL
jgi:hypothetical protein